MAIDNFGGAAEPPARVPLPSPLRWVTAAAAALLLTLAAFVGGWVAGRNAPKSGGGMYGPSTAPAPADWTRWNYPGSAESRDVSGGMATAGNARVERAHLVQLTTPDPFEQVLAHYARLFGQRAMAAQAAGGNGAGIRNVPGGTEVYSWVAAAATRTGVRDRTITYRTSNYDLVIHVSRADAGKQTQITISHMPHP